MYYIQYCSTEVIFRFFNGILFTHCLCTVCTVTFSLMSSFYKLLRGCFIENERISDIVYTDAQKEGKNKTLNKNLNFLLADTDDVFHHKTTKI